MITARDRKGRPEETVSEGVAESDQPAHVDVGPAATENEALPAAKLQHDSPLLNDHYSAKASSFSRFRLSQDFDQVAQVKKLIVIVKSEKPKGQAWFRVHPDEAYRMQVALLRLKDENEVYLAAPSLVPQLDAEVGPYMLYAYITRQGVIGIWPTRLPRGDGRTDHWMNSEHEAARRATVQWVRMTANMAAGAFDIRVSTAALPEPDWPDMSFEKLIELAFADHIIEDIDHPVLRRLRGEA